MCVGEDRFAESDALLHMLHPGGRPPAVVAEQFHHGGDEQHPQDGGVDEQRGVIEY
ncbi:hypothetical protein ACPESU_24770 [Nocardia iowensis]|uniref:hypothetical protein n=1 Tax=Nocardia iowensis TaxID=204891 RepID=UPI00371F4ECB